VIFVLLNILDSALYEVGSKLNEITMFFKDIPGKFAEKKYLVATVQEERLAHAQLFLGRSGAGQLAFALAFTSYLLCKNRTADDSCGACSACIKTHKHIHPDVHFSYPVVKMDGKQRKDVTSNDFLPQWRKAISANPFLDMNTWLDDLNVENGQANINVKECVEIVKKLSLKTFEAEHKILIMWMPEYLRNEGNRLLKLIEEPPDNTIIILVAEKQEQILNTILSRVQLLKIAPFSDEEISNYLTEELKVASAEINQITGLASGDLNTAIHLANHDNVNYSDALFQWLRIAYKMEPVELGQWVTEVSRWGRENQKHFLEYGLHFFREYLFSLITGKDNTRLSLEEKETATKMTKLLDVSKTENIISVLNDCIGAVERNANPKILFLADSMTIGRIMRNAKVDRNIYQV
jgi:DNA polymerase-3 subunit delta'|tara:strand:- start:169 stop:1392 length:1224 start_codon:yes stop_codon:yes gene_type:complete